MLFNPKTEIRNPKSEMSASALWLRLRRSACLW